MGFAACLPLLSYAKRPSNPDLMCLIDSFVLPLYERSGDVANRNIVVILSGSTYGIADFLIRSIIRTRLFNDYLGSLTNTPVIQRLPQLFNDYNDKKATKPM